METKLGLKKGINSVNCIQAAEMKIVRSDKKRKRLLLKMKTYEMR
jgi:hypothetical protein